MNSNTANECLELVKEKKKNKKIQRLEYAKIQLNVNMLCSITGSLRNIAFLFIS